MKEGDFGSMSVLVVDDEAFSQRLVIEVLGGLGINNVIVAENGEQAIEIMKTAAVFFDLVISDIEMPEMEGFELARRIRYGVVPRYKDIPILMLTGHSTKENVMRGRMHRIQGFIAKPPNREALRRHIERAFKPE